MYRNLTVAQVHDLLDEALTGIELGRYDQQIVDWLKRADQPTIVTVASLIARATKQHEIV
jgi:hypothetical protein